MNQRITYENEKELNSNYFCDSIGQVVDGYKLPTKDFWEIIKIDNANDSNTVCKRKTHRITLDAESLQPLSVTKFEYNEKGWLVKVISGDFAFSPTQKNDTTYYDYYENGNLKLMVIKNNFNNFKAFSYPGLPVIKSNDGVLSIQDEFYTENQPYIGFYDVFSSPYMTRKFMSVFGWETGYNLYCKLKKATQINIEKKEMPERDKNFRNEIYALISTNSKIDTLNIQFSFMGTCEEYELNQFGEISHIENIYNSKVAYTVNRDESFYYYDNSRLKKKVSKFYVPFKCFSYDTESYEYDKNGNLSMKLSEHYDCESLQTEQSKAIYTFNDEGLKTKSENYLNNQLVKVEYYIDGKRLIKQVSKFNESEEVVEYFYDIEGKIILEKRYKDGNLNATREYRYKPIIVNEVMLSKLKIELPLDWF